MNLFGHYFRSNPAQDVALASIGDAEQSRGLSAEILLAEFNKLAREIADRAKHQHALLNISIVSSGAIASFVLTRTSDRVLTIILAYLSSVLGALWLDHGRAIANIGIYLTRSLWPQLRQVAHDDTLSTREDWKEPAMHPSRIVFVLPLMIAFIFPAAAGLAYSFSRLSGTGIWILWIIGAVITSLSIAYWVLFLLNPALGTYFGSSYDPGKPR